MAHSAAQVDTSQCISFEHLDISWYLIMEASILISKNGWSKACIQFLNVFFWIKVMVEDFCLNNLGKHMHLTSD